MEGKIIEGSEGDGVVGRGRYGCDEDSREGGREGEGRNVDYYSLAASDRCGSTAAYASTVSTLSVNIITTVR